MPLLAGTRVQLPRSKGAAVVCIALAALCACRAGSGSGADALRAGGEQHELRVMLGRDLFFDGRLSADGTISCSTCHDVANGGDDGLRTAVGIHAAVGPINTPTVLNSSLSFAQFWDGRARTLQEQAAGPIHNPLEMGASWELAIDHLADDRAIVARFGKAYPEGLTAASIADALTAYESSLLTLGSPFDRYQEGDPHAIPDEAKQGYELFQSLGCISCHQGRAFGSNMFQRFGVMGDYFADRGTPISDADLGRYNVTGREVDKFRFKVPSLRNVADTAPYFHDGSQATLPEAVALMTKYQLGRPATAGQIALIVAFLETLSGKVDPRLTK